MITDAILNTFFGLVGGLLDLIPPWSPQMPGLVSLGASIGSFAGMLNGYFPVMTLFACAAVLAGYRLFALVWIVVQWVYSVIPFKMT